MKMLHWNLDKTKVQSREYIDENSVGGERKGYAAAVAGAARWKLSGFIQPALFKKPRSKKISFILSKRERETETEREREEKRANCCGPREFLKRREESKNKSVSETEEEREGVFRYI